MSMISNQIDELITVVETLKGKQLWAEAQKVCEAIDTIEDLSAKVRANNLHKESDIE